MARGEAFGFHGFTAIAFAPQDPRRVYSGCGDLWCYRDASTCKTVPMICGLKASDDGGENWRDLPFPDIEGMSVTTIAVHPWDKNILWIGVPNGGVFRSGDGGESWEAVNNGLWNKLVMSLAIHPHNPDILFAGVNNGGVFKSMDGGHSWVQSSAGMDPNEDVMAVVADPVRENVVFAGSISGGFFISQDGGATWVQHNDGLASRAVRVLAIAADGETLYAGTKGAGVYRLSILPQEVFDEIGPNIVRHGEEPYDPDLDKTIEEPQGPGNQNVGEEPEQEQGPEPQEQSEPALVNGNPLRSVCPVTYLPIMASVLVFVIHRKRVL